MSLNLRNRQRQMQRMCEWLSVDFDKRQNQLGEALEISQSMISGYVSQDFKRYADPKDIVKERFVEYLISKAPIGKRCDRWTVAEFTRYMDSDLDPQAFTNQLANKVVDCRQPVEDLYSNLSDVERVEFVEFFVKDQKKSHIFAAA